MGCAASVETKSKRGKSGKRDSNSKAPRKANTNTTPAAATRPTSSKPSKSSTNPLASSPSGRDNANKSSEFTAMFSAEKSSELSSISDDQTSRGTSRVNGSQHTVTTITVASSVQPASPSKVKGSKGAKVTHTHHRPHSQEPHGRHSSIATTASVTTDVAGANPNEPKWKRQVQLKRTNMTKSREGPDGISANKLARIQKWIDYSDQGTSPLGPLLDPSNFTEQVQREARLRDYVQQGIPLYAQASSTDPLTEQERRRSCQVPVKKLISIRVASKLKARMASALTKAKRRQSQSARSDMDLPKETSQDAHTAVDDENVRLGEEFESDGQDDTSEKMATGSLANVGHHDVDVMSHAVLEDRE